MGSAETDALIIALATRHGMVLTTRQLHEAGIDRHLIETRHGRLLTRVAKGVYVLGPTTPEVGLRAALAAVPASAASHRSAARLHRLPLPPSPGAEVLVPRPTRIAIEGVRIRLTRWLPEADVTRVGAARVTTVARTLCDLAGLVARARLRHLAEEAIIEGRLTTLELQACAAGYCRQGRAGSTLMRALDEDLLRGEPLAASELERRAVRLLHQAGIHGWVAQYRPPWYDGQRGIVDLAWPELRLVVELDGRRWHATTQAQADDRRRDRAAARHGWVTLRFGWPEVVNRPGLVVDECRAVIRARLAGAAPPRASSGTTSRCQPFRPRGSG